MNKEKSLKDKFYGGDSNWITDESFEKLKAGIEKKFPEIEISKDSEFILLRNKNGRELKLHRWKKFDYAPDGQNIESERTIEQEIEKFATESE
jgi:hypothetical protein